MNIHEYQARELFEKFGVATTKGGVANSAEEAAAVATKLGTKEFMVKAQIHAGGRGKGTFTSGGRGGEEFVDARQGDLDGFFDDEVFTGAGGGEGGLEVGAAGCRDAHHVEAGVGEKGGEIGGGKGGTVLGGEGFGFVRRAAADGDEPGPGGGGDGPGVKIGNQTESQNAEAERCGRSHVF
jgi:hypothetical protein